MLLFLDACADSGIMSVVYLVKVLLELVFYILPIILIVMILIDFTKNVMANGDDEMKKNNRLVVKRIIYCIMAFFVPTIVNVVINTAYNLTSEGGNNSNALACWDEASIANIKALREKEEAEQKRKEEEKYQANQQQHQNNQANTQHGTGTPGLGGKREETTNNGTTDNGNVNDGSNLPSTVDNYTIYVGDSRTHAMCINAGVRDSNNKLLKDNETCITAPGRAYSYFVSKMLDTINTSLQKYPNANLVINMGTNDVSPKIQSDAPSHFAKEYATQYKKLIADYPNIKLVVVSVTPFDEGEGGAVTYKLTADLPDKFNNAMKEQISGTNIVYCDVNSKVKSKFGSNFTYDGIHHHAEIDKYIYEEIRKCL